MGMLMPLLLIGAAPLSAAELKGWEGLRGELILSLEADPSEGNLSALASRLESLPHGPRLELARRFAAARPDSDAQTIVLADAYGVNGMSREVLATLEAALRKRPGDQNLPSLAAGCMVRWGFSEEALSLLTRSMEASSDPAHYLPWHLSLVEYSRELKGAGPARSLQRELERRVGAGTREIKPWLLLAQALSLEGDRPALRRLCESALGLFPEERRFYDHLAGILEAEGELPRLLALKLRRVESLPRLLSSDYEELAQAELLAGRLERARLPLAEGLRDDRLSADEKSKLAQRSATLDALWDEVRARAPERRPCAFEAAGRTATVECGGKRLAYDFAGGSFRSSENPAEAARLAGVLLERFARARFAAAHSEGAVLNEETLSRLKAAGYIQ